MQGTDASDDVAAVVGVAVVALVVEIVATMRATSPVDTHSNMARG